MTTQVQREYQNALKEFDTALKHKKACRRNFVTAVRKTGVDLRKAFFPHPRLQSISCTLRPTLAENLGMMVQVTFSQRNQDDIQKIVSWLDEREWNVQGSLPTARDQISILCY